MAKTNKELAVELASAYIQGIYSSSARPSVSMDEAKFKQILNACYEAVLNLPDDLTHER